MAQHDLDARHAGFGQQAQLARQQGFAVALEQRFRPPAHAPPGARGEHHTHYAFNSVWRNVGAGLRHFQLATQALRPLAAPCWSLTCATSSSRGSVTPFFTASTSAITLTAISGGVLLPM